MISNKSEMAEWILDFFRRSKSDTGHIIMMRTIQNKLLELNPRERDLFVPAANELIDNGYFSYEEGTPHCLRLTQKGRDFIYSPGAKLDCCQDKNLSLSQEQFISELHQSFIAYISGLKTMISALMVHPEATEDDKRALASCLQIVCGTDSQDVEKALSEGSVNKDVLAKIEKLNKSLVDEAVNNLRTDVLVKMFLRQLCYLRIEQETQDIEARMNSLKSS